jgi:uncharacterized protein YneF (UPF0154 family)
MNTKQTKIIAIIVAFILIVLVGWSIYKQIQEHYARDEPKLNEIREIFTKFFKGEKERIWSEPLHSLNDRDIMSEIILYRGNKSYTINKKDTYICLKDEHGKYYNDNMLIYVTAHEISHSICSSEVGHTELFHTIFEALLVELTAEGIYDPSQTIDTGYCANGDTEV